MAQIELLLPKMGESVAEATIIKWLRNEGESVKADEPVIEIATDKVDSEVPSPEDGVLLKQLVREGEVVQVGQPIALIGVGEKDADGSNGMPSHSEGLSMVKSEIPTAPVVAVAAAVTVPELTTEILREGPSGRFYSPLVRSIAQTEGIQMTELEGINGTGDGGRVTKQDILSYIGDRKKGVAAAPAAKVPEPTVVREERAKGSAPVASPRPAVAVGPNDEIVEMDRMRKLIADHMVMSKHTSPHVTSYVEADVTNIVLWRDRIKKAFETREKTKITYTPIFIDAVARAIRDFPGVNISVDGDRIIRRGDINIGMAAALPTGNLIVPVIRNADQLNLVGLTRKVNDLADRARNGKLSPDEIQGGTYTITNVGTFGNVMGTPIINQPQVAILAVGAIRKKPAVIETPSGDAIAIRHMMFLSHSYDHRVVDGSLGGSFVRRVADYLESWDINREI